MGTRFSGSDASALFVEADTNAADVASIGANQQPNTALTINGTDADGGAVSFTNARLVTVTTTGTGDAGKTILITGTDIDGAAQTEPLTMLGSATTVTGTSITGDSQLKIGTVASATVSRDITVPDEGILFKDGIYLQYDVTTFSNMTIFHA